MNVSYIDSCVNSVYALVTSTFQRNINDGKDLKYSHRTLVHESIDSRPQSELLCALFYDTVAGYYNKAFVQILIDA